MEVVFPRRWERDAVVDSIAMFPHVLVDDMRGRCEDKDVVVGFLCSFCSICCVCICRSCTCTFIWNAFAWMAGK